ncbi:hypothetical protein F5Y06DRAFT_261865 [Hypoxylon sp. FL0890]|nr:hypothetical protein F5Y06DRAFT_261865 [Hypoxylon sp. FL0890]
MDLEEDPEYLPSGSNSDTSLPSSGETARKRRRRPRPTEPPSAPPLKRAKAAFNPRYLTLLNEDITDATSGLLKDSPHPSTSHSHSHPHPHPLLPLTPTQLGAVSWTATEKQSFFSALARLGRDDLPGIASRIGSKSALEVHQYISLLDAAARTRRSDESKRRRAPRPADIPSAAELSTELCAALEEAGDGLALRQEAHEASLEQKRWGGRWLITAELAQVLERRFQQKRRGENAPEFVDDDLPPFVELFPLRNWLRLPERVFMNASVARFADGNWRSVDEERPAIRATALADFYSLAVSVTRRLVSAALFIAGSRIRAKQAGDRRGRIRNVVKTKDVQAAVASVGMKENSREFWARAARRLRLDVYGDEDEDAGERALVEGDSENLSEEEDSDEEADVDTAPEGDSSEEEGQALSKADDDQEDYESEPDIMSYTAVEAALGFPSTNTTLQNTESDNELREVSGFNISLNSSSDSDELSNEDDAELSDYNRGEEDEDIPMKASPSSPTEPPVDTIALEQDLVEALTYSALDYGDTTRSKQALRNRLVIEQRLWADAERLDARASAAEEARLWSLLRGDETIKAKTEEREPDSLMPGLESDSELRLSGRRAGLVDLGGNWRDHTEYYGEWEFVERDRRDDPDG